MLICPIPGHNITVGGTVIVRTEWDRSYPLQRLSINTCMPGFDDCVLLSAASTPPVISAGGENSLYIICLCIYMTSARQTHDASSDI